MTNRFIDENGYPPSPRLGWISPKGLFFPCNRVEHETLAEILYEMFYPEQSETLVISASLYLDDKGWIRITSGDVDQKVYVLSEDFCEITNKQIETIKSIANSYKTIGDNKSYNEILGSLNGMTI